MERLLRIAITELEHSRIFVSSREKMHETGIELYDDVIKELKKAHKHELFIKDLKEKMEADIMDDVLGDDVKADNDNSHLINKINELKED